MIRRASFIVITFLTLFIAFGCGGSEVSDGKKIVKVAFWGSPVDIDIITNAITKEWQAEHPDIKVVFEHTPYSGYMSKLLTRIAGDTAPDIVAGEVNLFVNFYSKGVLLDLTPFVENDSEFGLEDFFPEVVGRFSRDKRIYGVPRDTAPFACVYYNRKLFDKAGLAYPADDWNWDEMLALAQALTKRDDKGRIIQYGFYGWAWQNFVYSNGGRLVNNIDKPTKTLIDSRRSTEGIQFFADLINKYEVAPTSVELTNMGMGVQQMFVTGRLAMFQSGIWETPALRKVDGLEWDVAMFPKGPSGNRGFGTGGTAYCVLKTTDYPDAAWEVIKALAGDSGQAALAEQGLAQPANRRIA
ncbi:MAG: hypothetical protein AUJ75_01880, partial [Candidatus Omnitrophica bacterium CG1_02_49_10]